MTKVNRLFLASASPRRADILRNADIPFEVCPVQVDETRFEGESAGLLVARLAEAKALAAALLGHNPVALFIGADTVVEINGNILGKPRDTDHAREMLFALSGRTHRVLTGICVLRLPDGVMRSAVEKTLVNFAPLELGEIEAYLATGEPLDKAGGYAIQGIAGRFITGIEGCYFNVVGLPVARLYGLLRELGWSPTLGGR